MGQMSAPHNLNDLFFFFIKTKNNQHRQHNKSGSFSKGTAPELFSELVMQRVVIPGAYSVLFLLHHNHVCSAEKAYGLQMFIQFMWWLCCCIQSKHKSLGILLFFFLFPFTVCVALRMFLWTNRAVFPQMISNAPTLPKSEGAATLRK